MLDRIHWQPPTGEVLAALSRLQETHKVQAATPCGCIGPQNGDPVCPCQMRSVKVVDGRYVMTQDLGPARDKNHG